MSHSQVSGRSNGSDQIHQFYMNIINCFPDIVYWVDANCNLLGCNQHFVRLLNLGEPRHFKGTPYQQMKTLASWSEDRINALKLDDMSVIFSGEARYNVEEKPILNGKNKKLYFKSTRVPMFDENKKVIGLIVVFTDVTANKEQENRVGSMLTETIKPANLVNIDKLPSVLMIEDNEVAQHVEMAMLSALNCRVDIADSGDMALKLFDAGKYDLVLMDIGLEDTSGYVVAKQLRSKEKDSNHHVPIIALTGYEADLVKDDCKQYFMEGVITKPLTSEQADQIIKHYVYHLDVPVNGLKSSE